MKGSAAWSASAAAAGVADARVADGSSAAAAPRFDGLQAMRHSYLVLVAVAAVVQLLFFGGHEDNILATLIVLASSLVGIGYALDSDRFRAHPVSALILLMYTTTATAFALLVKTLEWTALVDRLQMPLTTFTVLFVVQLALLAADRVYLRSALLQRLRHGLSQRIIAPLGALQWPTDAQFWMMGLIGCVSVLLTGTDYESDASFGLASAGMKLIRAFGFLKFAPFLIPFRNALSGVPVEPSRRRVSLLPLALYFAALVAISFATNSRSTFADAIPTVALCALVAQALGRLDLRRVGLPTLLLWALAAVVAATLLGRVALAMVVVRDYRYNSDVATLVRMTFEALGNSQWLESAKARMDTAVNVANYSETYVDSRFLARFVLTKFHDNVLYYFSLMGPDQVASYKGFMLDRLAGTFPDPLLRAFGILINKQDLVVSNGDYVVYLVDSWGLGGFKTGSMIGETYGVWGPAFVLVLVPAALMLWVFHDAFVVRTPGGQLAFSPLILLLIWNLVGTTAAFGLGAESVTAVPAGILRGLPQNLLFYLLALFAVRAASRLAGAAVR